MSLVVARAQWCHSVVVVRANSSSAGVGVVVVGCARDRTSEEIMLCPGRTEEGSDYQQRTSPSVHANAKAKGAVTNIASIIASSTTFVAVATATVAAIATDPDSVNTVNRTLNVASTAVTAAANVVAAAAAATIALVALTTAVVVVSWPFADAVVSPATATTAVFDASTIVIRVANEASIKTV